MSKIFFVKYHSAGNDFILIDDRLFFFDPQIIPFMCHRKFGIGADGVILLQNEKKADFRMRIFNQDGTEAESCGNGLKCLGRFLVDLGFAQKKYRIATFDRIVAIDYINEKVRLQMGKARNVKRLYIEGREIYFLDTGVPHAVLFVQDVQQVDVKKEGFLLRHHAAFMPRGANVNFAAIQPDGSVFVRTFERGLEAETMACGTGAAAVGCMALQKGVKNPIRIVFPGGEMEIQIDNDEIQMIGDAVKVFEGFCLAINKSSSMDDSVGDLNEDRHSQRGQER